MLTTLEWRVDVAVTRRSENRSVKRRKDLRSCLEKREEVVASDVSERRESVLIIL
jgi:hypothetical protein